MAKYGQRRCLNCGEFFDPDCRNAGRQHYCSKPECRCASKAAAQAAWQAKPQNIDYFRDPSHVARVQAWRAAHPGYSRGHRKPFIALRDNLPVQEIDLNEETPNRSEIPALQDTLPLLEPILTGLIAHMFGFTLHRSVSGTRCAATIRGLTHHSSGLTTAAAEFRR